MSMAYRREERENTASFQPPHDFVLLARWLCLLLGLLVTAACRREQPAPLPVAGPIQLHDVTPETGITFLHNDGSSGRRFIIEPMCAGLALFDYDDDGLTDVYFLNGAPLPGTTVDVPPKNHLYRNLGHWKFVDVTDPSGTGDEGYGLGVTAGDFDNDGDQDLYLNNNGPNVLYRNNGDGTFTDVTTEAGVGNGDLVGAGAAFLDMDSDGDLDLYVANYLAFDVSEHVERTSERIPILSIAARLRSDPGPTVSQQRRWHLCRRECRGGDLRNRRDGYGHGLCRHG